MKIRIIRIRDQFKRTKLIQIIRNHLEPDTEKAKEIADTFLSEKACEIESQDLSLIEKAGISGLDLLRSWANLAPFYSWLTMGLVYKYDAFRTGTLNIVKGKRRNVWAH